MCFRSLLLAMGLAMVSVSAAAQADIKTESPSINAIKKSLADRFVILKAHFEAGDIGLTHDGRVALRAGTLAGEVRAQVERLIVDDNKDRETLIREIARANGRADWEDALRDAFAERWRARAAAGWWLRGKDGQWSRK